MKMKMKIVITKNIIDAANKLRHSNGSFEYCHSPVSLALNSQTVHHGWYTCGKEAIRERFLRFELPQTALSFLKVWMENPKKATPVTFYIPRNQVTDSDIY